MVHPNDILTLCILRLCLIVIFAGYFGESDAHSEDRGSSFTALSLIPKDRALLSPYQSIRDSQLFDGIARTLNEVVRIPHSITIAATDCGFANAFYDSEKKIVFVCYELYRDVKAAMLTRISDHHTQAEYQDAIQRSFEVVVFAAYHEIAHALIRELHIPIAGREEDAADQIAALILVSRGVGGYRVINSTVMFHAYRADQWMLKAGVRDLPYDDTHSLDAQRMADLSCLAYGSAPDALASLVGADGIPRARAERCPGEFQKVRVAWQKLFGPYLVRR